MPALTKNAVSPAGLVPMCAREVQFLSFTDALPALILKFALAAVCAGKPALSDALRRF